MAKKRPCRHPGCRALTDSKSGFCEKHYRPMKRIIDKAYDRGRKSSGERGYDGTWQKLRAKKLNTDPLCERCSRIAEMVHHLTPIEVWPQGRLVWDNLQSLCWQCHSEIDHEELCNRYINKNRGMGV